MIRVHRRLIAFAAAFLVLVLPIHFFYFYYDANVSQSRSQDGYLSKFHNLFGLSSATTAAPTRTSVTTTTTKEAVLPHDVPAKPRPKHVFHLNGLLEVNPEANHPVYGLIEHAEAEWKKKLKKVSRTLEQAVEEYVRRYGRRPPPGFDLWWAYVQKHKVQLPDEYDQIHRDLEPFWGISPEDLQAAQAELEAAANTYTFASQNGKFVLAISNLQSTPEHQSGTRIRWEGHLKLLAEVQQWLPDFRATFAMDDGPAQFIGYDLKRDLISAGSKHTSLGHDHQFDRDHIGWASACPESSPLRSFDPLTDPETLLVKLWDDHAPKTFIHDHKAVMDPCIHPNLVKLNGVYLNWGKGPSPGDKVRPAFSLSTTLLHSTILITPIDFWVQEATGDKPWLEKQNKLRWRGATTGTWHGEEHPWKLSQRIRLANTTAYAGGGSISFLDGHKEHDDIVEGPVAKSLKELNMEMMDIRLAGRPLQCADAVCEELLKMFNFATPSSPEEDFNYKYLLDVDGNAWSARFKRLMTTRAVVFKSTIFPEWYTDRLQPWYHYVPVKYDYTDMYDIVGFFQGAGEDSLGNSHDKLAQKIGQQGRDWSQKFWRNEDMTAYMFRLYLEYARVCNPNRRELHYSPPNNQGDN